MNDATCFECGQPATAWHHVVPESLGGTRTVPLCHACHHKVHSPGQAISFGHLAHLARGRKKLVWICETCQTPIDDKDGYIHLPFSDILSLHPGGDALLPDATWRVQHRACDLHPEEPSYAIDVERIRSVEEALEWTFHLGRKRWAGDALGSWEAIVEGALR